MQCGGLTGPISREIGQLTKLEELNLKDNQLERLHSFRDWTAGEFGKAVSL